MEVSGKATANANNRLLERAVTYVSDHWIPISPITKSIILKNIDDDIYQDDVELLLLDLSKDLGLFTRCISQLKQLVDEDEVDPMRALRSLDIANLIHVVRPFLEESETHSFENSSPLQNGRIQEAMISKSAAQTLAPAFGLSEDLAVASASLRQLGFALIAWNYPSVYAEAISKLTREPSASLEHLIAKKLGFTPSLLASRLAYEWGLPVDLCKALYKPDSSLHEDAQIISGVTNSLLTLCRIGEALARANQPDVYPTARDDWEVANQEIQDNIGARGVEVIRERFVENCRYYIGSVPDLFRAGLLLDPAFERDFGNADGIHTSNPFLEHCSPVVRDRLNELYSHLKVDTRSEAPLRFLMHDVVPTARFTGTCVYTLDPQSESLLPQLSSGLIGLRTATNVYLTEESGQPDPISEAYLSENALHERSGMSANALLTALASIFGKSQRLGVMYAEIPTPYYESDRRQNQIHFKALCQALNDCLRVK